MDSRITAQFAIEARNITWLAVALLLLAAGVPAIGAEEASSPEKVFPVTEKIYGNTYGEWSAFWHRWFLSIPADKNPPWPAAIVVPVN